ncbi:polyketide synthase, partial [Candidatus Magnetomorum sp. HK-1]
RMAGVSSFGFSGTNAHVIIEEYHTDNPVIENNEPQLIVLSANNKDRLHDYAERLLKFCSQNSGNIPLVNMAYTLQTGRKAMNERLALVVSNMDDVIEKLTGFLQKSTELKGIYTGNSKKNADKMDRWIEEDEKISFPNTILQAKNLNKIAPLWIAGMEINWQLLYDNPPKCISLPTYPFEKTRYWLTPIADLPADFFYVPGWETLTIEPTQRIVNENSSKKVLIVLPEKANFLNQLLCDFHEKDQIWHCYSGNKLKQLSEKKWIIDTKTKDAFFDIFDAIKSVDIIYFLGGYNTINSEQPWIDQSKENQEKGVLCLFKMIKALIEKQLIDHKIQLVVFTQGGQPLYNQVTNPFPASLYGFCQSLQKEHKKLDVYCLDLHNGEPDQARLMDVLKAFIRNQQEHSFCEMVIDSDDCYVRSLNRLQLKPTPCNNFRKKGVYLILGGAGGIGLSLARYLSEKYQANLVLIGRSTLNDHKMQAIAEIESLGGKVKYICADARNFEAMKDAVKQAKEAFQTIHGVVHSAIVLRNRTIKNMDESAFGEALAPKIDGSIHLYEAIKNEPLDFIMFFSSAASVIATAGQSNYVAGCTFKDAFAFFLSNQVKYPVKLINWGYWGSVGIIANKWYKDRLKNEGILSIEPHEGMKIIERVMAYPVPQLFSMKITSEMINKIVNHKNIICEAYPARTHLTMDHWDVKINELDDKKHVYESYSQLHEYCACLLIDIFQKMGMFISSEKTYTIQEVIETLHIIPSYHSLTHELISILSNFGYIHLENNQLTILDAVENIETKRKEQSNRLLSMFPELKSFLHLLETCVNAYPQVLTGQKNYINVMFPNSRLDLVEGFYKNNAVADYYNTLLASIISKYVEHKLSLAPNTSIHIMEVGAGTGGTTSFVLRAIQASGASIQYDYTDISRRFTEHGNNEFASTYPFCRFFTYNLEKSIDEQSLEGGSIDILLATNVFHATRNIEKILYNAKCLLKTNGLLILNEITKKTPFTSMTFGLTKGWWLFEDKHLRIQNSPFLSEQRWKTILKQCGFHHIQSDNERSDRKGVDSQRIIFALSNGLVLKKSTDSIQEVKQSVTPVEYAPEDKKSFSQPVVNALEISETDLKDHTQNYIKEVFSKVLKLDKAHFEGDENFDMYGVDSLLTMKITDALETDFGHELSATLLYENPSIDQLTSFFLKHHKNSLLKMFDIQPKTYPSNVFKNAIQPEKSQSIQKPHVLKTVNRDIAIIGVHGRYPQSNTLDEFWDNLKKGRDCIEEIPKNRWDIDAFYDADQTQSERGKMYSRWGGFIHDVDCFDPLFFNISPREAAIMDPQERVFMETVWGLLETAGYTRKDFSSIDHQVGVFVGVTNNDYDFLTAQSYGQGNIIMANPSFYKIANRISYFLNFNGPSMAIDTACSSSLTAIHLACESILTGKCHAAIAGGVNLILTPMHYMRLCAMNMLSDSSKCKSFGKGADGFIDGEGVGAVLLKSLDAAIKDNDHIWAVVKSTSANAGGKTSGFTVPNPNAQSKLIVTALNEANINPRSIGYVETHGTGTSLGDPIEVKGLINAYDQFSTDRQYCAIGSVKTNIGHLESAAGIAGLTKVLLQMKYQQLVPSLHSNELNPKINFENSPFIVQQDLQDWKPVKFVDNGNEVNSPLRAGISSFGAGGSNAHIILEAFGSNHETKPLESNEPHLIVLSAKNADRLNAYILLLADYLDRHQLPLADVAYTLQVGREAMEERLAVMVYSIEELLEILKNYPQNIQNNDVVFTGNVTNKLSDLIIDEEDGKQFIQNLIRKRKLSKIGMFWVSGIDIDWQLLYDNHQQPKRISLPTYPFEKNRYWIRPTNIIQRTSVQPVQNQIHPLLHKNISSLTAQQFSTRLTGNEFFLTDHVITNQKILPGAAYLEMALAACRQSTDNDFSYEIADIVWIRPIVVTDSPNE